MQISELYIYPVKSLAGISRDEVKITDRGFEHDRRWMLVDEFGRFITQREHPKLCLLGIQIIGDQLNVFDKQQERSIQFPLFINQGHSLQVSIWDDSCEAIFQDSPVHDWFSSFLGKNLRLVYMPDNTHREIDRKYAVDKDINSFSDGYPILIIGQSSLDDLNQRLDSPVGMNRFRPNLVYTGGKPFEEDTFKKFQIGDQVFHGVKPCARCILTTVDPDCGQLGKEPLQTLATFRKTNSKIYVGQNTIASKSGGHLKLGDHIQVIERKPAMNFDS
jgi:uncharacterized protein YcbX